MLQPPERAAMLRAGVGAAAGAAPTLVPAALAAALLLGALFAGESFWLAALALAAATLVATLALLGRLPLARGGGAVVGALLAIATWNGVSVAWSIAPDRSWDELNRGLVYTAFAVVGLALGSLYGGRATRVVAALLTGALAVAILWALAGKAIPALFPDGGRAARLRDPIGYWNALALVADALLVLGLWLAATRPASVALRAGGAVLAYAAVIAILLSGSRAGVGTGILGILLWIWLERSRTERALLVLATTVPALAVAGWAFTRPALVDDGQAHSDRVANGAVFALVFLLGAALVALAALRLERVELGAAARLRVGRSLAVGAVAVLLAGGVLVAVAGDPLVGGRSVAQGPERLVDAGLNNRRQFWGEAWRIFEAKPLTGAGAGTFELARKRYRQDAVDAPEPHNLPLQFLAGTGTVGWLLFAALVAAVAVAAAGALRRLAGEERRAAAALAIVPLLYLVHALVDYDWSFAAVTAPTLVAVGALASSGRPLAPATPRPLAAGAVAVVGVAALLSLATPWLAERSLRQVNSELDAGDVEAAIDAAERARSLDPLSIEPLHRLAGIEASRNHIRSAREAYAAAIRLQPENPDTWYALGAYEHSRRFLCQAYFHLNEAYTRDPRSTVWFEGGPLDEAREFVNAGGCG
jgi:O-antigen ligase